MKHTPYLDKPLRSEAEVKLARLQAANAELVAALERIVKRATPHVDDTDDDRRRDLYHIDEIARAALAKAKE